MGYTNPSSSHGYLICTIYHHCLYYCHCHHIYSHTYNATPVSPSFTFMAPNVYLPVKTALLSISSLKVTLSPLSTTLTPMPTTKVPSSTHWSTWPPVPNSVTSSPYHSVLCYLRLCFYYQCSHHQVTW